MKNCQCKLVLPTQETNTSEKRPKNRFFSRIIAPLLLAIALLTSAAAVTIAPTSGTRRLALRYYWANTPRDVFLECAFPYAEREAVRAAMGEWNAIRGFNNQYMVTMFLTTSTTNNSGRIYYEPNHTYVGHTYHYESDGGAIQRVEVVLNSDYPFTVGGSSTSFDIQSVVQHELGHALGVAHCHEEDETCFSSTCSTNVMTPEIQPGVVRTNFEDYDIGSYKRIYS